MPPWHGAQLKHRDNFTFNFYTFPYFETLRKGISARGPQVTSVFTLGTRVKDIDILEIATRETPWKGAFGESEKPGFHPQ